MYLVILLYYQHYIKKKKEDDLLLQASVSLLTRRLSSFCFIWNHSASFGTLLLHLGQEGCCHSISPFVPIFKITLLPNRKSWGPVKFHVSHFMCHIIWLTYHVSCVRCQVSHVTYIFEVVLSYNSCSLLFLQYVRQLLIDNFWKSWCYWKRDL